MTAEELQAGLSSIVASSDDAIVSKDLNGIVQSWNEAEVRIFGYSADEMIGQSITKVIPKDRLGEEERFSPRFVAASGSIIFTLSACVRTAADEISVTVSPVRKRPESSLALKIARDVTETNRVIRGTDAVISARQVDGGKARCAEPFKPSPMLPQS